MHKAFQKLASALAIGAILLSSGTTLAFYDDHVNRAELLKMLIPEPSQEISNCFRDVKNQWFASQICFAKSKGWVKGYGNSEFMPARPVTFAEALKMILATHELPVTQIARSRTWYAEYFVAARKLDLIDVAVSEEIANSLIDRETVEEILARIDGAQPEIVSTTSKPKPYLAMAEPIKTKHRKFTRIKREYTSDDETDDEIDDEEPTPEPAPDEDEPTLDEDEPTPDPDPVLPADCDPLDDTHGTVYEVASVSEIRDAVTAANASGNATILVADGTYNISQGFMLNGDNITIRSASGDRDSVIIKGGGMSSGTTHVFWVQGSDVTIADMTIGWVKNHPIQVQGEYDTDDVLIHNMKIFNGREQLVKVSADFDTMHIQPENGILECSVLGFPDGIAAQNYTGGIDAHNAKDWIVRDNYFFNIISPNSTITEHAIHFWSDSEGTLVENNTIINCDRGIGFGLSNAHHGGIIRDNKIYNSYHKGDTGIALWHAEDVLVEDNIVIIEHDYYDSIEYRFDDTTATIRGNIVNKPILSRDGGHATLEDNYTNAQVSWFEDPENGDFSFTDEAPEELR